MKKGKFCILLKLPYDCKNARAKFVDPLWNTVSWNEANERLEELLE